MAGMKEASAKFDELKRGLESTCEKLGSKTQTFTVDDIEVSNFISKLESMKAIGTEVSAQQDKLEEMQKVGDELLTILDALDCKDTPKGKDIQNTLSNLPARLENLKVMSTHKQKLLDERAVNFSEDWLAKTKLALDAKGPVSLDRDILNEQITYHRSLVADLDQYSSVIRSASLVSNFADQGKGIALELETLKSEAEQRKKCLERAVEKLESFNLSVYQLESWYAYANQSIKQESIDLSFSLNKIDTVFKQRNEKLGQLDDVRSVAKTLLDDPQYGDKEKLREHLQELDNKWEEVTTNLARRITSNIDNEMQELTKYVEKASSDLDKTEPISGDVEIAAKQYNDHQTYHDALKKQHKSVSDKVNNYKSLYKTLMKKYLIGIVATRWTVVHKEALAATKRSDERLAQLEEAQPAQMSADINIDDILENWIELDTLKDDMDKKEEKKSPKSSKEQKSSLEQVKYSSPRAGKTSTDGKSSSSPTSSKSAKESSKSETQTSEKPAKVFPLKVKVEKKAEETTATKQGSKETDSKQVKTENIKSEKKNDDADKSKVSEKVPVIVLPEKKNQDRKFRHGVMLTNLKDTVSQADIQQFLKPIIPKVVDVMFYKKPSEKHRRSIIILSSYKEADEVVSKLNKKVFQGQTIALQRVEIQHKGSKSAGMFDHPSSNQKEETKAEDSSKPAGKGKILTLAEIKTMKMKEVARRKQMQQYHSDGPNFSQSRRLRPQNRQRNFPIEQTRELYSRQSPPPMDSRMGRSGMDRPGVRYGNRFQLPGPGSVGPSRMHIRDMMHSRHEHASMMERRDREDFDRLHHPDMGPTPEEIDLEMERRKVRIEQERLEQEKAEAEKERLALEREKFKRQMMTYAHMSSQRSLKRSLSPARREDGSYWIQPKRFMENRSEMRHVHKQPPSRSMSALPSHHLNGNRPSGPPAPREDRRRAPQYDRREPAPREAHTAASRYDERQRIKATDNRLHHSSYIQSSVSNRRY